MAQFSTQENCTAAPIGWTADVKLVPQEEREERKGERFVYSETRMHHMMNESI